MATKGTRTTAISWGVFQVAVSMKKAEGSRDIKTEYVNAQGETVLQSGERSKAKGKAKKSSLANPESKIHPIVEKPDKPDRAVRISKDTVVRLPADALDEIEETSKAMYPAMEVLETIDYRKVPTERIKGSYWLQPDQGSAKGLLLIHMALADTDKVAVVKWVGTSVEKLGVIRPRWVNGQRAMLLSELAFANDFMAPDDDALEINNVEGVDSDSPAYLSAINLVTSFSRPVKGGDGQIDKASNSAVDARIELMERLQEEQLDAELAAAEKVLAES